MGTLELVARGAVKLGEVVGAIVGQGMALEPGPQVFHRIEVGCIRSSRAGCRPADPDERRTWGTHSIIECAA